MIDKIQKRNGDIVAFDSMKIMNAIDRANKAVEGEPMTPTDLLFLTEKVSDRLDGKELNTVEHIQDLVEEILIRFGYARTAKAYICTVQSIQRSESQSLI